MKRARTVHAAALLLGAALLAAPAGCGGDAPARPSLILVSLDTCRADRLSCYGAARENTPFLDAFARDAVRFEDCLAQSALTAPSHMSLLTGHYVHRHGLLNNQGVVDPPITLASHLAAYGYRTAAFTGHGSFQAKHGLGKGFEVFESSAGMADDEHTRRLDEAVPGALRWLDSLAGEPFFLLVHGYDPHCPYWPPEPWRERYTGWYRKPFKAELQELCHPKRFGEKRNDGTIGRDELRCIDDMYDAGVASADATFGAFLGELERRGLLETSIVVFTSDHGEVLGNHGWIGHGQVWEEALRVPLIVRFPGGRWAGTIAEPVQLVDVLPTLCAALDELSPHRIGTPPGQQGIDLMPLVRGEQARLSEDRMRLARVGDEPNLVAVRFGTRWKAVFQEEERTAKRGRLYDLEKDPLEARDLVETEKGHERFAADVTRYMQWRVATADEDERFRGHAGAPLESAEDLELLKALGYAGEGSEPDAGQDSGGN